MILADKIIKQRKKNGWSQEELADKMNVSRQAVSKWESAQTIPDIDKIMQLGELFGVTIDYLLKDSIEDEEIAEVAEEKPVRKISLEYANTYLAVQKKNSWLMGVATFLCILSPIVLMIFGGLVDHSHQYDNFAFMGVVALFAFILAAVPLFIVAGHNNEQYKFLDKIEPFDLEYGVKGVIKEKQKAMSGAFKKWTIAGVCTAIFAPIPVIVGAFVDGLAEEGAGVIFPYMVALTLLIAGVASSIFVVVYVQKNAMQKLLREEDYTDLGKKRSQLKEVVSFAYWMVFVVAYLIWSLVAGAWEISWILLAGAGMLFPAVMAICNYITDKKVEKENKNQQ